MSDIELEASALARGFLAVISILLVVCGTSGNFLVWYGSVFHSAIKLECCSRVLITNLALTDIFMILFLYIPLGVTAVTGKWVFGQRFCLTQSVALQVIMCFEIFIMMSLNCYRLWAVKKTKGDREKVKPWHVQLYLIVMLVISFSSLVVHYFLAGRQLDAGLLSQVGLCSLLANRNTVQKLVVLGYMVPPLVISIIASKVLKCILCHAAHRAGTKNSKSQRAISLVCWAMIISYLPTYVAIIWEVFSSSVPNEMYIVLPMIMSINLLVNPAIYFYYNTTFRAFVVNLFSLRMLRHATVPSDTTESK